MEKICLKDCRIGGIPFNRGVKYKVNWNPMAGSFFAYTVWGYTPITDDELKTIFV